MDGERLAAGERDALDEFLQMTREDVAARAASFEAADDPLGLGHAAAAVRWRELEAAMREAAVATVGDLPERAQHRWAGRLNARSRVFSRPDPVPARMEGEEEPAGWPVDLTERHVRAKRLGRTRDPRHVRALSALLRSDDEPFVRAEAARALGSVGGDEATEALLMVTAAHRRIRGAIARSLGVLGEPRAVPKLMAWLEDRNVRDDAMRALGRIGEPAAVPALEAMMDGDARAARRNARRALVNLGHPDAVEALRRRPRRSPLARRRELAAAERAVARRRASATGEPAVRAEAFVPRLAAGGVQGLVSTVLLLVLAVRLFGVEPGVYWLTLAIPAAVLALLELAAGHLRHERLDLVRHRAAHEPRAIAGPAAATVLRLMAEKSAWLAAYFVATLGGEWATGGSGVPSGLIAAVFFAGTLDRLLMARFVLRWQRDGGERLLYEGADRGSPWQRRVFFARREV